MHCDRCNTLNEDGAVVCRECGHPLTGVVDSLGERDTLPGDDGLQGYVPPSPPGPGTVDKDGRIISLGDADTLGGGSFMAEAGDAEGLSTGDLDLEEGAEAPTASAEEEFGLTDTLADRFDLLEKLGEGGMGVVYKARDRRLRRLVALKRLTARTRENKRAIERFRTEATTVASLDHAGIVRIYNLIEDERGICLELEFVGGGDLQSRLDRDGALPVDEACDIVAQLCDAVSLAHEQGVIHRDIKPANVLLTPRGTPKLSDFGLARAAESGRTVTGSLLGTLHYAAPEQLVSGKHVDERSDIYALGATLYALVTGEPPRTIRLERVPAAVRETVGTCLEENPAKRYQTAEQLKQALEAGERRAARIAATACPECGSENPLDARFCQQCGGDLSSLFRTCPKCGKDSRQDVEFCGGCGTNLARHFAVQALLAEARRLRDGHNHAEALRKCEEALELDPDQGEAGALATELRGVLATITERLDAAEKAEAAGRLEEAVACYEEVLQLDPGHEGAEGSVSRLREAIAESERRAKAEQGRILAAEMKEAQNRHDYERAIEKCRAILELYPAHPHAKGHLERLKQKRILELAAEVRSAQRAGDLELAEDRCHAILAVEPQHREAQKYLERLERFASSNMSFLLRKAEKALDADDLEIARDLCARVEELAPEDAAARDRIERIKGRMNAVELHRKALEAEEAGQVRQAFALLKKARRQWPDGSNESFNADYERVFPAWRKRRLRVGLAIFVGLAAVYGGLMGYWHMDAWRTAIISTAPRTIIRSPKAPSEPGETQNIDLGGGVSMELVWIPPGEFMMGSPPTEADRDDDEGPQHKVRITQGFWIGKHEVTQAQWQAVMGENPSRFTGDRNPVEQVSWNDCQEFVKKLSQKAGATFLLPTEAEWEYACRAGSTTAYCFGDDASRLGDYAWYDGNSEDKTHPVGQKKPNAWGLYDMHGNVWERCEDVYDEVFYRNSLDHDPFNTGTGDYRVLRGGSWMNHHKDCRSANRLRFDPADANPVSGFRVMCVPPSKEADETGPDTNNAAEEQSSRRAGDTTRISGDPLKASRAPGEVRSVDLGGGVSMELVWIPPGEFMMGSPPAEANRDEDEGPQHAVRITDGFWMGRYEVTQAQAEAVMGGNPSRTKGPDYPVENLSWNDCQGFVKKLSQKIGVTFRLPTEAEWEYACRAGSTTAYFFGKDASRLGDYAWYDKNSGRRPQRVGQKKANAWGLYDIAGNVSEWCEDRYDETSYRTSPEGAPLRPETAGVRVIRGGNWFSGFMNCRSADRAGLRQNRSINYTGFRVVCEA